MSITVKTFSGLTGEPLQRLDAIKCSWSDSINETGSIDVTITAYDAQQICAPWKIVVAAFEGDRIVHAGYVEHLSRDDKTGFWDVNGGGGLSILEKRLVLNPALITSWKDGKVKIDEEHPSGDWPLKITGSYSDLVRSLINATLRWGQLPITVAASQGGNHERTYNSYDYATVLERIQDIADLEDGPEIRLDPFITSSGRLSFRQRTETEIVDTRWRWNASRDGTNVILDGMDIEGDDLCTESFASAGREDEELLVARSASSYLINMGYPVLQIANTEHTSVKILSTLKSYSNADVAHGRTMGITRSFKVPIQYDVKPGDWADVRIDGAVEQLKITDVSGDMSEGWLTVQACGRY